MDCRILRCAICRLVFRCSLTDPCYPGSSSLGVNHENQFMSVCNGTTSMLSFVICRLCECRIITCDDSFNIVKIGFTRSPRLGILHD